MSRAFGVTRELGVNSLKCRYFPSFISLTHSADAATAGDLSPAYQSGICGDPVSRVYLAMYDPKVIVCPPQARHHSAVFNSEYEK